MKEKEDIITLIQKLLALSKSSNENEAGLAAAKAQELLFKYNLELSEIEAAADSSEKKARKTVTKDWDSVASPKNYGRWKVTLVHRISRYNFCDVILYGRERVLIVGQPHNIAAVKELYSWIGEQILRFASEACRNYTGFDRIPTFRRSFLESAANTVCNRLYRQWEASKTASENSTALVIRHEAMVKEYIEEQFPDLRKGRSHRGGSSYDGHRAGIEAGNKVDIVAKRKLGTSTSGLLGRGK